MNSSDGRADRKARSTVKPPTPESNTPIGPLLLRDARLTTRQPAKATPFAGGERS